MIIYISHGWSLDDIDWIVANELFEYPESHVKIEGWGYFTMMNIDEISS